MSEETEKQAIAAGLAGAGLSLRQVAGVTGISIAGVRTIVNEKVPSNVDGLGDIYAEFRNTTRPIIQSILLKTLSRIDRELDGKKVSLRDLVTIFRGMSGAVGVKEAPTETRSSTEIRRVDLSKPELVKALREALHTERGEQMKELKATNG
jgi:hypothetical protein